jgi:copper chaperone CopZ
MTNLDRETSCDWTVSGMDCGSCANKIRDAVGRLPGVSNVEVGLMTERLRMTLDEAQTGRREVAWLWDRAARRRFEKGIRPAGRNRTRPRR